MGNTSITPEGYRVLIVDDTEASIDILIEALGDLCEVLVATSGEEAMEQVLQYPPDLILLDIIMSGMDGYETCRRLKQNPSSSDIPIIFITAMNYIEDETKGLELGAVDYIIKPISPPIVKARVRNHLELQRASKRLKEQARQLEIQNRELIETGRLKEDIEHMTRHDLKAPLNAIINFPAVIKIEGGLSRSQNDYLDHIVRCGYMMLKIVNLSLDMLKMERGLYQLSPEPVDIVGVLRSIEKEATGDPGSEHPGLDIRIDGLPAAEGEKFIVRGETLLCYSMLSNLIINAMEASPEDPAVEIDLRHTSPDRAGKASIEIHNRTVVPYDIKSRFFEKYITHGKQKGTGLGTYSAKLFAETQGGEIEMITSRERGTSVFIYLGRV